MESFRPFTSPLFQAWIRECEKKQYRVSVVVTKMSNYAHFGDLETGLDILNKIKSEKKRKSLDWIGNPSTVKELKCPLNKMSQ